MIVLIVFIVVLETRHFHIVLAFYESKSKFACMHIHVSARFRGPKNKNKNSERRAGLHFDRIHEKLNYPKRFTDNIEKKIKYDLFFIKTIGLGPRRFHCFTEFFTGTWVRSPSCADTHKGFCSWSMLREQSSSMCTSDFMGIQCTLSSGAEFPPRKMLHDI